LGALRTQSFTPPASPAIIDFAANELWLARHF
jgi:hypothetical protein